MKFKPHDYQRYAIEFIEEHPIAAVLLDMGLGKTVITLTAIEELMHDRFEVNKVLVVGPLRVARDTWPAELKKWDHLKNLKMSVAVGNAEERKIALMRKADIYVINRENLPWLVEESGVPLDFDMLVLDELSSYKNPQAKRAKAALKVRMGAKRVVGLSGTPAPNSLEDLFSEYRILDLGKRLGRFLTRFRTAYFRPVRVGASQYAMKYEPLPFAEEDIYNRISDITISMKSTDYLKMPERIESEYVVKMDEKELDRYMALKSNMILPNEEITAANAATLCGKLVQMANGAIYNDNGKPVDFHDRKLDALEDMVEAANGKPILVAYWYQHDLDRISNRLSELGVKFDRINTSDSIERWNRGEIPVGLIHPASAGHGLNLQEGGSTIIWFGMTWSLELYQQTNGRLWRQGQKDKTVVIQHIVCENTIDGEILRRLEKKDMTQEALIAAVKAEVRRR